MKPEKVGKNKTYRKKPLKSNQEEKESPASWKLSCSTVICSTGSAETRYSLQYEQASSCYNTTEDADKVDEDNAEQIFDISTLAETCVLDQLEHTKSVELPDMIMEQEANSSEYYPLTSLMSPDLDLTLEEEFKIHELEAIKESLFDGCFKAMKRDIPNFQKQFSSLLISLSQGVSSSASSEAVLIRQKIIGKVICNDLFEGGKICKLLNCYSGFQNVPDKVKIETFKFSLAVTDLCSK